MARRRKKKQPQSIPLLVAALLFALLLYWMGTEEENPPVPVSVQGTGAVHFIDVGQGDSVLITTEAGAMLIDTGEAEYAQAVIDYIRGQGIDRLAYAVATHPHSDHIGGMARIINEFPIETFIAPDALHTTATFERMLDALEASDLGITVPEINETFTLGEAVFTALSPDGTDFKDLNNASVVLRLEFGGTRFLFTGDAEESAEQKMLANGLNLACDVLKVGHHGSNTSSSAAFLQAVSPSVAVISCGADNSYGHPHREVVERLDAIGAEILRTDQEGHIVMVSDGTRVVVME